MSLSLYLCLPPFLSLSLSIIRCQFTLFVCYYLFFNNKLSCDTSCSFYFFHLNVYLNISLEVCCSYLPSIFILYINVSSRFFLGKNHLLIHLKCSIYSLYLFHLNTLVAPVPLTDRRHRRALSRVALLSVACANRRRAKW